MKRITSKLGTCLLSALLILETLLFIPTDSRAAGIDDFVTRCYKIAFERTPDESGFNYWKSQLTERKIDGSVAAYDFIFSTEYISQQTSDEQYIKDLYEMFMGREPDQAGYDYWTKTIAESSRESVFEGFANSDEFYTICKDYNIPAGFYTQSFPLDQVNNVNLFVDRMYRTTLGRIGDKAGQRYWTDGLLTGTLTGISCAANYIFSSEYLNKELRDEDYIKNLYTAFMGREYDDAGLKYWADLLSTDKTREDVFAGFANSPEFTSICASYGIVLGTYEMSSDGFDPFIKSLIANKEISDISRVRKDPDGTVWYSFYVAQPVDWNDPQGKKFMQKVHLGFSSKDEINVIEIDGYALSDIWSKEEISETYNANCLQVEHRFFGDSVPDGFDKDPSPYWKYLTTEQAAYDFHHILTIMKTMLHNKWVFTGVSKGGEITNFQSMMFPNDADVYVSYVAPLTTEQTEGGIGDYAFNKIGDTRYGKEKAKKMRDTLTDFLVLALESRDVLQPELLSAYGYDLSIAKKNGVTPDQFYEYYIYLHLFHAWQFDTINCGEEKEVLDAYKRGDKTYIDKIKDVLAIYDRGDLEEETIDPYYVQCAMQIGISKFEFAPLRDTIKERGSSAYIATKEEEEDELILKMYLPNELIKSITFDKTYGERLLKWNDTTGCTVIRLYGGTDIWSYLAYPETDNPNVHTFVGKTKAHDGYFSDSEVWPDVKKILDEVLTK